MALELLQATSDTLDYGVVSWPTRGKITIAFTIEVVNATASNERFASEWGAGTKALWCAVDNTDELSWAVDDGSSNRYGLITTGLNLTTGLYRVVVAWAGSSDGGPAAKIWVNGVQPSTTSYLGTASFAAFGTSGKPFCFGLNTSNGAAGVDGIYNDTAVWADYLDDSICEALTKGFSPRFWRRNGVIYSPCIRQGDDEWGGLSPTEVVTSIQPHPRMIYPARRHVMTAPAAAGGAFTLTAEAGSFSLTGQAAGLTAQRKLTAAQGSFALSGQSAGLAAQRTLAADLGAFVLAGQDAALTAQRVIVAAAGAFTLTGQDVAFVGGFGITAESGSFALTGQDAGLVADRVLPCAAGVFVLAGQAAGLVRGFVLVADAGAFVLTGQAAALLAARILAAAPGTFTLTGQAVSLTYLPIGLSYAGPVAVFNLVERSAIVNRSEAVSSFDRSEGVSRLDLKP